MSQSLTGMDVADLQAILAPGHPPFRARQLYHALYKQRVSHLHQVTTLPASLRTSLAERYDVGLPEVVRFFDSQDGTRRYLLRLHDGKTVEAVLMPEENRQTICISTQVGCAVNCQFCLTAQLGLERNLSAGEILGQVLLIASRHQLSPQDEKLNLVMMGMGEPLLNLPNVLKAARILADPDGFAMSLKRITVSTAGITPKIAEFAQSPWRPKLAISLNASTEEQRRQLMPITRKYSLKELMEACRSYPLRPWERLTFEYVLLKDVNDSDADARCVVKLLAHLKAKVNLIALNPGPGVPFSPPPPERVLAFQSIIRKALPCFIRKPRGQDIYAACGQLKRTTDLVIWN
jgi:23S rRNA (adenine2503-C2)-methyltransferase